MCACAFINAALSYLVTYIRHFINNSASKVFGLVYKKNRIYGLDIFRTAAILTVVLGHGKLIIKDVAPSLAAIPLPNGVEIFFVLSGFLIGQIIFNSIQKNEFSSFKHLTRFWRFRWFRTLPNYYLILILNIVLAYFELTHYSFDSYNWKFWLFLQNFAWPFYAFYPESWSLAVEEWFYLLFPAALILAMNLFKNVSVKRTSLIVILVFIFIPVALKFWFAGANTEITPEEWGKEIRRVVVFRLDSIIIGVFFAWLKVYANAFFEAKKVHMLIAGLVINLINRNVNGELISSFSQASFLVINGISMALLLPFFNGLKSGSGMIYRLITYVSVISYAMYVVHFSLVLNPMFHFLNFSQNHLSWIYFLGYWVFTFVISHLLYKYFEKPMTDLRQQKRAT